MSKAPSIHDHLTAQSRDHFDSVLTSLQDVGVARVAVTPTLVRVNKPVLLV